MSQMIVLPKGQKIFSMHELKSEGLSEYKIRKLASEKKLIKLNKSYFENAEYTGAESDFYYVKAYAPEGIICLLSAAVYYQLTVYIPDAVDIAIPRKAKISAMPQWPQFNVHYYTEQRYRLGIMNVSEGRNGFQIYNVEKTVVDIIYYREQVGIEETREILENYLRRKDRNINLLMKYAELMKCEKVTRQYLEVLV